MLPARVDVVVAGLGAMGSAAVHHLASRGLTVLGVDPFRTPHTYGSTHGESRIIREAYFEDPFYVALARRASALWRDLEASSGRSLLRTTGALTMGPADSATLTGVGQSASQHGVAIETLSRGDVRQRFPGMDVPEGMAALLEPGAGVLDPEGCVEAHLEGAAIGGAEIRFGTRITGWEPIGEGVRVRVGDASVAASGLVLACGSWLPSLVPAAPLEVERQTMHWFEPRKPRERFRADRIPAFLWETPEGVLFYGVPDLGRGVKVARHHGGTIGARDDLSPHPDGEDVGAIRTLLGRFMPEVDGRFLRSQVCWYTNTPDHHFLIDRHPHHGGIFLVSACSGHGFKFAPVIGEIVADLVTDGSTRHDISHFRLARF